MTPPASSVGSRRVDAPGTAPQEETRKRAARVSWSPVFEANVGQGTRGLTPSST